MAAQRAVRVRTNLISSMINKPQPRHVKNYLVTSRIRRRRRVARNIRIVLFLLLIISIAVGFVYLCRMDNFQLKDITVSGTSKLDKSEIKQYVLAGINENKSLFGLVQPTSSFFISERKIDNRLTAEFPRIETVETDNTLKGHMKIMIVERQGKGRWCRDMTIKSENDSIENSDELKLGPEDIVLASASSKSRTTNTDTDTDIDADIIITPVSSTGASSVSATMTKDEAEVNEEIKPAQIKNNTPVVETCFEFDKSGYIFDNIVLDKGVAVSENSAPEVALLPDLAQGSKFKGLIEGDPVGQRFLDEEKIGNLIKIISFLNTINLKNESISCQTENLCTISISHNGLIHLDISSDLDELIQRMKAAFESKALKEVRFKYVDVRYGNKIFYKTHAQESVKGSAQESVKDSKNATSSELR